MKKIIILILACLIFTNSFTQQVWYFGQNAGIKFPSGGGLPSAFGSAATNPIKTSEGCAIAYDINGNIIISTDGSTVYDKNNTAMSDANGDLMGGGSSTQSGIIVPVPGCNCNKYFVFTVASLSKGNNLSHTEEAGLRYSVVDLNLNPPNGNVIPSKKNIPLISTDLSDGSKFQGYSSEKLTACKDGKGGYWVLAHGVSYNGAGTVTMFSPVRQSKQYSLNTKRFYAFHISSSSVGSCSSPKIDTTSSNCTISDVGLNIYKTYNNDGDIPNNAMGQMKFSSDGTQVAFATWDTKTAELFDFNLTTGKVSNNRSFGPFNNSTYGIEFSPNGSNLYVTTSRCNDTDTQGLYELDLLSSNPFTNKYIVKEVIGYNCYRFSSLQLWNDGRIYVANGRDANKIGVIKDPNLIGTFTNYDDLAIDCIGNSSLSLPTFIQDFSNCADPCNKCHNVSFYLDKMYTMRKDTTIKIGCGQNIDFNPNNGCSNTDNVPVLGVTVKDNANNTPAWANTFITSNGSGNLTPPSSINTYTVTYYFGTTNPANNKKDTCDKIVIIIKDTCIAQQCFCGGWPSIAYTLNGAGNKKFNCNNPTSLFINANQGDVFSASPTFVCADAAGNPATNCSATIKYDIYFPKGTILVNQTSLAALNKLDSCGNIRVVMKATCGTLECPNNCEFTINVNCCKCAQNPEPMLLYGTSVNGQFIMKREFLKCGETYTDKLDCFKPYTIVVASPCGPDCEPDEVITTILQPNGVTISGNTLIANQVGTYIVTIKVKCNGKWCEPCVIKFVQTKKCDPPCNNCKDKVSFEFDSGASTVDVKTNPTASTLNATFVLGGGADTYTQVRANIVDFQITSDNPACLQCYNIPNQWGSIVGGNIPSFTSAITSYPGVSATGMLNSSREIVFSTPTPAAISMGTNLNIAIKVPGVNPLSCCCIKVVLYVKITYRNNKCEECTKIVRVAFDECPGGIKNSDANGTGTNGGSATFEPDGGQPQFKMHSPNKEDAKMSNKAGYVGHVTLLK